MFEQCKYSSGLLENRVNDMMDLVHMEKNTFKLFLDFFDLPSSIANTFQTLGFLIETNMIKTKLLVNQNELEVFQKVLGDKNRIEQTMINFLSNALKFTPKEGSVTIHLTLSKLYKVSYSEETNEYDSSLFWECEQ